MQATTTAPHARTTSAISSPTHTPSGASSIARETTKAASPKRTTAANAANHQRRELTRHTLPVEGHSSLDRLNQESEDEDTPAPLSLNGQ
jgi:hypothetical protein